MTRPKLALLRRLRISPFLLFIAILERFVSDEEILSVRTALDPAVVVTLEHLDEDSSVRFFAHHARRLGLSWTEAEIEMLARTMHGYPSEMAHVIARLQKQRHRVAP